MQICPAGITHFAVMYCFVYVSKNARMRAVEAEECDLKAATCGEQINSAWCRQAARGFKGACCSFGLGCEEPM